MRVHLPAQVVSLAAARGAITSADVDAAYASVTGGGRVEVEHEETSQVERLLACLRANCTLGASRLRYLDGVDASAMAEEVLPAAGAWHLRSGSRHD